VVVSSQVGHVVAQYAVESKRWRDLYASLMFVISNERFEVLASEALDSLPGELAAHIENLVVVVDDQAKGLSLFGLYEGVPLTKRGPMSYSAVLPDRITLYQATICRYCNSEEEVRAQIRKTVIHEVAHHFGISDPRLHELGWA
jgi:predicted Zn-dependent protease with MMP-like domain